MVEISQLQNSFENTLKYIKSNIDLIEENKYMTGKLKEDEKKLFESFENEFQIKYKKYMNMKRFSIPIVGMTSSGKSSFLNFLLGINCLETNSDITTKCVIIIRHNKELRENEKKIYSVKIIERVEGFYNFEKDKLIKNNNINEIISERNKLIKNLKDSEVPNREDFFLIMEANIPLFTKENEKFGNFFEFLDLPGLDEGKKESISFKHSHFFKEEILPKIAEISKFSIYIFDAGKYLSENNPLIYKEYLDKYCPLNYNNSFFIMNKIDKMENENREKKKFLDEFLAGKLKIDLKNPTIHIKFLSCLQLNNESTKYKDFLHYLKSLITEDKEKNQLNFVVYMKKKMIEEFKLDLKKLVKEIPPKEIIKIKENYAELKESIRNSHFTTSISDEDFYRYSKAFDEIKTKNENAFKNVKFEKYEELFLDFNNSFTDSFNNFVNIPNDKSLIEKTKEIEGYFGSISSKDKEESLKTKEFMDSLYKGFNKNLKIAKNKFYELKPIIDILLKYNSNLDSFKDLKNEFEFIDSFIKKDKKLRIPLLGGYSTGKSSLLNSIIGKMILPKGNEITTRYGVVVRNNNDNKFIIYKTKFYPKGEYYCFEEGDVILSCDESNYKEIYEFLDNQNKNKDNLDNQNKNNDNEEKIPEDMFYLLSCPILLFKEMEIEEDLINKIEFIDYPGIDVEKKGIDMKTFNPLISLSDTFIFVNICNLINVQDNIESIQNIAVSIENRKSNFDYNSCLFILNKVDEAKNINISIAKKQIELILFGDNKLNSFKDFFKKKEKPNISVLLFSNKYYEKYLSFYEKIKDFDNYLQIKIDEIKEEKFGEDYNLIEELQKKVKKDLAECDVPIKKQIFIKDNNDEKEKSSNLVKILMDNGITEGEINNCQGEMNDILQNYNLIKNNINLNINYKESRINILVSEIKKKIIIAKEMTEKDFERKIEQFLNTLDNAFKMLQKKTLRDKAYNITEVKEQLEKEKQEVNKEYIKELSSIIKEIDNVYKNLIAMIDIIIANGEREEIDVKELKKGLEDFKNYYYSETNNLNKKITSKIHNFEISINKKINKRYEYYYNNIEFPDLRKESAFSIGLKVVGIVIVSVPILAFSLIGGILGTLGGLIIKIKDYFKNKQSIIKDLINLKRIINDQWNSLAYKTNSIFTKLLLQTLKKLNLIYESKLAFINENDWKNLYNSYLHLIGDKYEGTIINDKKEGYGIYYWYDGSKYEGYYKNDCREGFGKMFWKDGNKYIGNWVNGDREGFGILLLKNGNYFKGVYKKNNRNGFGIFNSINNYRYEGEYNDNNKEGFGCYYWDDGCKYIGEMKEDYRIGIGIFVYNNGDIYEGEWNLIKNGIGTYYFHNGNKYEGEWKNGNKNGKGIFYLGNDIKFEGYWKNDRMLLNNYITNKEYILNIQEFIEDGKILINYIDGDIYEGQYNPNKKVIEGIGTYYFNNGNIYKGNFKENQFEGKGELSYIYGDKLIGIFNNGVINGKGEIHDANGDKSEGEWKKGLKNGIFIYYDKKDNTITKSLYENNKFIKDID